MTRPTCASVYSEKPAYTSIKRENSFFSSALSEAQGRTMSDGLDTSEGSGLSGVSAVPFGRMPFSIIRGSTVSR
jgi:hypothetical protein